MRIERVKLTMATRAAIQPKAVVRLKCREWVNIPSNAYATFHIRLTHAADGLKLLGDTPFPPDWSGSPEIIIESSSVKIEELNEGEEIGELWIFHY